MVRDLLEKPEYENRSKKRKQDFSRNRKMPFKKLMYFMLGMVKESSQNALERFFPKLKEAVRMSQQAFSLARQNPQGYKQGTLFQEFGMNPFFCTRFHPPIFSLPCLWAYLQPPARGSTREPPLAGNTMIDEP
ncbi:MAG: hypothetical protein LBG24_01600 [Treponema sp.]|jgi:hypothetical protein|nr:hypothetical protein [Treponema sp.]